MKAGEQWGQLVSDAEFLVRVRHTAALCYARGHDSAFAALDDLLKELDGERIVLLPPADAQQTAICPRRINLRFRQPGSREGRQP